MGVAVDFRNTGVGAMVKGVIVVVVVVVAVTAMIGTVLNILRGKLLVAAVGAAWRILPIDIHLQQNGEIEADLQRSADPELRRCIP